MHRDLEKAAAEASASAPNERQPEVNVDLTQAPGAPKQPNDRDEQAGMTGGQRNDVVEQGAKDKARGLEDTSRAEATDATYKKLQQP